MAHTHNGVSFSHKKGKVMSSTTPWIELEAMVLTELSQTQKHKYNTISLIFGLKLISEVESRIVVS